MSRELNTKSSLEVEASRLPYSKSHAKRLKRKAKEELAGGGLSDIRSAIAAMESSEEALVGKTLAGPSKIDLPVNRRNPGLIGEGKGVPLSQTKRKNALYVPRPDYVIPLTPYRRKLEKMRHHMVIANSDFRANPFHAVRTHAQNTLVKHTTPTLPS
jgi:ribosome biogenesis protein SLX9